MTRTKSALIVFVVLAGAVATALSVDYTDTYVADRFRNALEARQYEPGVPFSLDAYLDYYDWDTVCVAAPGSPEPDLRNLFGLHYSPGAGEGEWSMIFSREGVVVAEVVFADEELLPPTSLPQECLERWAAFVEVDEVDEAGEDGSGRRLVVVGH
jgi:hypothetical protein